MDNSNIFNADMIQRQQSGHGSQGAGFVRNFHIDGVNPLDRAAGSINEGIPIASCGIKKMVQLRRITSVDFILNLFERTDIAFQKL